MPVSKEQLKKCMTLVKQGVYLNTELATARCIPHEDRVMIGHLQLFRGLVHLFLKEVNIRDYPQSEVDYVVSVLTAIEYRLQQLWNLGVDPKFIRFWRTPGCQCPQLDNEDQYGYGRYVINQGCPLHKNLFAIQQELFTKIVPLDKMQSK